MHTLPELLVWNVGQDKKIFRHVFLLKKLVADRSRLFRVDNEHSEAPLHSHLHSDVVSAVDRFDQLVELTQVPAASAFEFF